MILITRPLEDSERLAARLAERGLETISSSLLKIEILESAKLEVQRALAEKPAGIILTSKHAARALKRFEIQPRLPIYAVGSKTAKEASGAGLGKIAGFFPTASALIEHLREYHPAHAPLLYCSGDITSVDLAVELSGMTLQRVVVYRAKPVKKLSPRARVALRRGELTHVMLFSARTAEIFKEIMAGAEPSESLDDVALITISEKTAAPVRRLGWSAIFIAPKPTEESMIELLEQSI